MLSYLISIKKWHWVIPTMLALFSLYFLLSILFHFVYFGTEAIGLIGMMPLNKISLTGAGLITLYIWLSNYEKAKEKNYMVKQIIQIQLEIQKEKQNGDLKHNKELDTMFEQLCINIEKL